MRKKSFSKEMSFEKVAILSLFVISSVLSLKDFERCDVGKGKIVTKLSNLSYTCPKHNEIFRMKWFIRQYFPYFEVSTNRFKIQLGKSCFSYKNIYHINISFQTTRMITLESGLMMQIVISMVIQELF